MKILLCGADGFLGRHIAAVLAARGHVVLRGVHKAGLPGDLVMDFRSDISPETWLPRLAGVDVVINAVGILRESRPGDFDLIHHRAPAALFEACRRADIRRVIQISALGTARTPYLSTKHAADEALRRTVPGGIVLRPGLVFGEDGVSTRFFLALASVPIQADVRGAGPLQPVHVADLVEVVSHLVESAPPEGGILEIPGPRRLSYGEWMATYRVGLGLAPALTVPVSASLMSMVARLAGLLPGSLLSGDTWAMLRAGNTGDALSAQALLGHPLKAPEHFVAPQGVEWLRLRALAQWRRPLLQAVLAVIWFVSALTSAAIYPVEDSVALLAAFGLAGVPALLVLAGATGLDLLMGVLTLTRPGRRLWLAQLCLVAAYSLLVAWRLPVFLIHPFGPILKNLAVATLLVQLWAEEQAR
jgi:uncharacterized protein YbjT (DUF2867 family)